MNLRDFIQNLAATRAPNKDLVNVIAIGFNIAFPDLHQELVELQIKMHADGECKLVTDWTRQLELVTHKMAYGD